MNALILAACGCILVLLLGALLLAIGAIAQLASADERPETMEHSIDAFDSKFPGFTVSAAGSCEPGMPAPLKR